MLDMFQEMAPRVFLAVAGRISTEYDKMSNFEVHGIYHKLQGEAHEDFAAGSIQDVSERSLVMKVESYSGIDPKFDSRRVTLSGAYNYDTRALDCFKVREDPPPDICEAGLLERIVGNNITISRSVHARVLIHRQALRDARRAMEEKRDREQAEAVDAEAPEVQPPAAVDNPPLPVGERPVDMSRPSRQRQKPELSPEWGDEEEEVIIQPLVKKVVVPDTEDQAAADLEALISNHATRVSIREKWIDEKRPTLRRVFIAWCKEGRIREDTDTGVLHLWRR
jgi:hypothetical protein